LETGVEQAVSLNTLQRCRPLLGTFVELDLCAELSDAELLDYSENIYTEIERLQNLLSFHDLSSELTQVNQQLLTASLSQTVSVVISNEFSETLDFSLSLWRQSHGVFDVTIAPELIRCKQLPTHFELDNKVLGNSSHLSLANNVLSASAPVCIDLGGIAKGYVVDKARSCIPKQLVYCVNAGGDLATNQWQNNLVSLKYAARSSAVKTHRMLDACLATSGNYYRAGHSAFISPVTKKQVKVAGSVSVFANSVMTADALTKLAILLPRKHYQLIEKLLNVKTVRLNRFGFSNLH
jgi:thiamine biosynthesis lipoprotein